MVETLIATGVVIALAGAVSPLLASVRQKASDRSEMTELRQLALAQGMYTADTQGIPMSTLPLVTSGYVRTSYCASPLDVTRDGYANQLDQELGEHSEIYQTLVVPYRSSYLGLREFKFPYDWTSKYLKGEKGAAWLVSLTTSNRKEADKVDTWYTGNYRRVMLDGSVQSRQHEPVMVQSIAGMTPAEHYFFLFEDGTNEWKRKFISGSH